LWDRGQAGRSFQILLSFLGWFFSAFAFMSALFAAGAGNARLLSFSVAYSLASFAVFITARFRLVRLYYPLLFPLFIDIPERRLFARYVYHGASQFCGGPSRRVGSGPRPVALHDVFRRLNYYVYTDRMGGDLMAIFATDGLMVEAGRLAGALLVYPLVSLSVEEAFAAVIMTAAALVLTPYFKLQADGSRSVLEAR
jgi:hypothetical protein